MSERFRAVLKLLIIWLQYEADIDDAELVIDLLLTGAHASISCVR